tara:strand:+ start:4990 stop:5901 length:912 start_codon:yes stop_codon:yes gene_type:complete
MLVTNQLECLLEMIRKLILGTVQFGLDYGINNNIGKPTTKNIYKILDYAYENEIKTLDTAESYGNAHPIIGDYLKKNPTKKFKIITKLSSRKILNKGNLKSHLINTIKEFNIEQIHGYMIHDFKNFIQNEYLLKELELIKREGFINIVGISLYENDEIVNVINNYNNFDFIQVPFNILDNEIRRGKVLKLAKKKNIKIFTRSTFLQGLFFKQLNSFPSNLNPLKKYIKKLKNIQVSSQTDINSIALNYCLSKKYIDKVLIGVDSLSQLKKNLNHIKDNNLNYQTEIDKIIVKETKLLNPTNWN